MMEMERTMAKRFDDLGLPGWVSDGLRRVLGTDAEVQRLNGASGLATDGYGEPAQGLRPGYGRGGMPAAAQLGVAFGALAGNWASVPASKAAVEASRPPTVPETEYSDRDKYFHCRANCQAAQAGPVAEATAGWASDNAKEFIDEYTTKGGAEEADREANRQGRRVGSAGGQCYEGCKDLMKSWVVLPQRYR